MFKKAVDDARHTKTATWTHIKLCPVKDLNCHVCLGDGGQAFTWENLDENTWMNVIDSHPVIIRTDAEGVHLYHLSEAAVPVVRDYLRLDEDLFELCAQWSQADPKFPVHLTGIRLLRQDPLETLFAFICSQNNVIQRIRSMVRALKTRFGSLVGAYKSPFSEEDILQFYSFPETAEAFRDAEQELRGMKFGYRAKYISGAARYLQSQNLSTSPALKALRHSQYDEVIETLLGVPGVGPKVADCIALMSLDQLGAVPIDTHIWRVARERYKFSGASAASAATTKKTLTQRTYRAIGDRFRDLFGPKAGWAHSLVFTAELVKSKKSLK